MHTIVELKQKDTVTNIGAPEIAEWIVRNWRSSRYPDIVLAPYGTNDHTIVLSAEHPVWIHILDKGVGSYGLHCKLDLAMHSQQESGQDANAQLARVIDELSVLLSRCDFIEDIGWHKTQLV